MKRTELGLRMIAIAILVWGVLGLRARGQDGPPSELPPSESGPATELKPAPRRGRPKPIDGSGSPMPDAQAARPRQMRMVYAGRIGTQSI